MSVHGFLFFRSSREKKRICRAKVVRVHYESSVPIFALNQKQPDNVRGKNEYFLFGQHWTFAPYVRERM